MFSGFTPETVDFLWGIRMNNNRDWFQANKQHYTDFPYHPMKELGQELFVPFADKPGNLLKVSRIYRDARMHHPLPYKESLWICIRKDVEWWAENPCLFFEINPEGVDYGFFFWKPRVSALEDFRREEERRLPADLDYEAIAGLRLEARQKLNEVRPLSIGQAARISGVSPSDIAVLLIYLEQNKQ